LLPSDTYFYSFNRVYEKYMKTNKHQKHTQFYLLLITM